MRLRLSFRNHRRGQFRELIDALIESNRNSRELSKSFHSLYLHCRIAQPKKKNSKEKKNLTQNRLRMCVTFGCLSVLSQRIPEFVLFYSFWNHCFLQQSCFECEWEGRNLGWRSCVVAGCCRRWVQEFDSFTVAGRTALRRVGRWAHLSLLYKTCHFYFVCLSFYLVARWWNMFLL